MTLDSLSESSLLRLEQYLNSNPYREYSMSKPYFPKTSYPTVHSNRLIPEQQSSVLAFHELMDNQKNTLTLDRLAYKLRMKSDLNIDTLRETHIRRRRHHHYHHHHHQQQQQHYHPQHMQHSHHANPNLNDTLSSMPSSSTTKTFIRQPTSITMSTNTMKTIVSDDLSGIEGNSIRVGTLDDLIKQFRRAEFRLVRRPADYLDSASTYISSNVSTNDRTIITKLHQHHERPIKQPQALTEYRFNAPTFPTTPTRTYREPPIHQGLIYQYRTRERIHNTDLPLLNQRSINLLEHDRQRLNPLVIQERQPTAMSSHDKRIHELREKTLTRTEKQLCVCNKLTIVDPFNSSTDQIESSLSQFQQLQQQQQPATNYIFPPVRPFGYFTKKTTTTDDIQQLSWSPPPPRIKKKHGTKKTRQKVLQKSLDSLDKIENDENNDLQLLNDTIKSMVSLTDIDDEISDTMNTTINIDLKTADAAIENTEHQNES
ncbi:unnamed protein product [Rotaria sordida]|uniref:Uncharacterized protein n=1 Tax=Rotaria sordida TaxID=392033 RepID=A0A818LDZ9_9BILA|nr:unnamed protein product [Rotaria sordida]CAF0892094.1 unnamed protein product [Rotaria sordida]CAF1022387.1 unnamed protein product [Rotaria sordida]CAF3571307.1 unnamed protein product [Rotaria sordida]CAF3688970.1 unnamed protein product [Rotaria sordida]